MNKQTMMRQLEQEIADLQELWDTLRRRIRILEEQEAGFGPLHVPVHVRTDREGAQKQLREVQNQLEVLEAALEVLKELGLKREPTQPRQVQKQLEVLKPEERRDSICLIQVIIALVALVIGVVSGGMAFSTIQKGGLAPLLGLGATPTPQILNVRFLRTGSEIDIDGELDDPAWREADSLTYAEHPAENDYTKATVRFLWDYDYLYVGFEVDDTQVEQAGPSTPWDSDSVSLLLHDGGIAEHRQSLGEELGDYREIHLKDWTTKNVPDDRDNGYTVEMQIRWIQKPPPSVIWADLLSVDHDDDPYDLVGDKNFSKLTWDGDGDITSAGGRLLLVDEERSGGEGFVFRISEFGALLQQKLTLREGSFYTVPLD
jgi:hypothetical protein